MEEQKKPEVIPLTSPEFLFLLERMDRIEERIRATENSLRQEIKQEVAGVRGLVWTAMGLILGALALTATVIVSLLR